MQGVGSSHMLPNGERPVDAQAQVCKAHNQGPKHLLVLVRFVGVLPHGGGANDSHEEGLVPKGYGGSVLERGQCCRCLGQVVTSWKD